MYYGYNAFNIYYKGMILLNGNEIFEMNFSKNEII